MDKKIKNVTCEVKQCLYHCEDDSCQAKSIKVGNPRALHESETKCETFACKDADCKTE